MRQRIIYILKHNAAAQLIYRFVLNAFFQICNHIVKTDTNLVLFVSFMGKGFNDSPKVIYDSMQNHPELSNYHCVWAFEEPTKFKGVDSVRIDTLSYFYTAMRAKFWITNTNIERGLHFKKKEQKYLNTWHGIPLKHVGNDVEGRKDFDFSNIDYLCVCGDYDEKIFKSAFHVKESSYLRCGLPRNEELWKATDKQKTEMRIKLGIPIDKKVILYAPTWRESTDGGKSYEIKPPIHFDEWKEELGNEYVVLFRAHHQTTRVLGVQYNEFVREASFSLAVNDLMIAADILITDYSAIAFDFSILCRPIFCFAYDLDSYLADRGTYFQIDEKYPNKCCRTENELLARIKSINYEAECANTRLFRDEFMKYGIGATEACIKAEFGKR